MGLPLFKTPMEDKLSATADIADHLSGASHTSGDWPDSENDRLPEFTQQNEPRIRGWSLSQTNPASSEAPNRPAVGPTPQSRVHSRPESPARIQAIHELQEASRTQNNWRPLDPRPRNVISGTDYVEGRLRDAVGMEVERFSQDLYTRARNSATEQDRQVMEEAEMMIDAIRRDLRRVVDARMGPMIRPTWAIDTGSSLMAPSRVFSPYTPVPLDSSADSIARTRPETPTTATPARRGSFGFLRPSPASIAQLVPQIEPLSISISPESIPATHHVDRAATPPIRSAAPSPPAIVGHVRGRHSPPS
ncbi:hypothetical protein DL98DRAFT_532562 [Cadophora sp. DSE1049]|nr:hypothetical protein DL98DRAFT_532562 [Cadophora sp. DSE1049]